MFKQTIHPHIGSTHIKVITYGEIRIRTIPGRKLLPQNGKGCAHMGNNTWFFFISYSYYTIVQYDELQGNSASWYKYSNFVLQCMKQPTFMCFLSTCSICLVKLIVIFYLQTFPHRHNKTNIKWTSRVLDAFECFIVIYTVLFAQPQWLDFETSCIMLWYAAVNVILLKLKLFSVIFVHCSISLQIWCVVISIQFCLV